MLGSPSVAQFAELQEHSALVRLLGQIGESFAQFRERRGTLQAKERVDLPLDVERRHIGAVRVLTRELVEHLPGTLVVRLAIQRETQIVFYVIVARIYQCRWGQLGELLGERLVELCWMTAIMAIPGAGIE